jgi:precorrin-6B methylase 2
LNKRILDHDVQCFIRDNTGIDVNKIALSKSPFEGVSSAELAGQIAGRKKCRKKLSLWYKQDSIYYPPLLSLEQCSSEATAAYKSKLALKGPLIDLTGGFGVDSVYFSTIALSVVHCEINGELSEIAAHNAGALNTHNMTFIAGDGIEYLKNTTDSFQTIYLDPARRGTKGKVFMLEDCAPNVVEHLDLLLSKSQRIIIKTAPLLDLSAGLKALKKVSEVHILSVKNECKELLWLIDIAATSEVKIVCATLNAEEKQFSFFKGEEEMGGPISTQLHNYLYEPDAALLKSGAFKLIAEKYGINKLHEQTQLYTSDELITGFPGRIFEIKEVLQGTALKKEKNLAGNVIVRNFKDSPEMLIKKHRIRTDENAFLIFTQSKSEGYILIKAAIRQYY